MKHILKTLIKEGLEFVENDSVLYDSSLLIYDIYSYLPEFVFLFSSEFVKKLKVKELYYFRHTNSQFSSKCILMNFGLSDPVLSICTLDFLLNDDKSQRREESPQIPTIQCTKNQPQGEERKVKHKKKEQTKAFTSEEDNMLRELIRACHETDWEIIAKVIGTKNARQCRERWEIVLNPRMSSRTWTKEEDILLINMYAEFGPRWKKISMFFVGRSEFSIKSRWNLLFRKTQRKKYSQIYHFGCSE